MAQQVPIDPKAEAPVDIVVEHFKRALVKFDYPAAAGANQVVMVTVFQNDVVGRAGALIDRPQ